MGTDFCGICPQCNQIVTHRKILVNALSWFLGEFHRINKISTIPRRKNSVFKELWFTITAGTNYDALPHTLVGIDI